MAVPSWLMLGYSGIIGIVGLVSLIFGGAFLARKFFKFNIPFISSVPILGSAKFAGIFAVLLVVLISAPFLGFKGEVQSVGQGIDLGGSTETADDAVAAGGVCVRNPNAATQNVLLATENIDDPADAYIGSRYDLVAADGKTVYNTGSSNTGATLSYLTITVPHCVSGDIYVLGNSSRKIAFSADQPQSQTVLTGSVTSRVNITPLNYDTGANILANGSAPSSTGVVCPTDAVDCGGDGQNGGLTDAIQTNFTLGSGGSQNFKFQMTLPTANSRYGAFDETYGVILSAYISDLTVMSAANGVKINSLDNSGVYEKITCPADISANRRANVCWKVSTLKSGGTYTVTGTFNSDLGNIGGADFVDIYINDLQWFKDTDGTYKLGAYDLSGTDVGTANSVLRSYFN